MTTFPRRSRSRIASPLSSHVRWGCPVFLVVFPSFHLDENWSFVHHGKGRKVSGELLNSSGVPWHHRISQEFFKVRKSSAWNRCLLTHRNGCCWSNYSNLTRPKKTQMVGKSKGWFPPKMAETFRLRIYNKLPGCWEMSKSQVAC